MSVPRQCCSCGSFCGGGFTSKAGRYRPCKNTATAPLRFDPAAEAVADAKRSRKLRGEKVPA